MISAPILCNRLLARGKFRHIQVLLTLAELGSVLRTAEAIGMTQSSVTQTLAYLERLLEIELFERHARGVRPTAICVELLPVARQLMLGIVQSAESIAAQRNGGQSTLRLVCSASALNGLLLTALPDFADAHPQIQIQLREAEGEDLLLTLTRAEVDLAVCRRPQVIPAGWRFESLQPDRLAILAAADHPLAGSTQPASLDALARQTWIMAPAGSIARRQFDHLATRLPRQPAIFPVVSRSPVLIHRLLRERHGLALLPLSLMQHHVDTGELTEIAVDAPMAIDGMGLLLPNSGAIATANQLREFLLQPAAMRHDKKA